MKLNEMMKVVGTLPDEVQLGQVYCVMEEFCPAVIDSPQYRLWRKAVIAQEMYQNALIDAIEDAVVSQEEDNPLAWLDKYTNRGELT